MEDRGTTGDIVSLERLRDAYDQLHEMDAIHAPSAYYGWVLDLLGASVGEHLLDIACGSGYLLQVADRRGLVAFGVDFSEVAVRRARCVTQRSRVVLSDAEVLPWKTETFDYATNLGSLEHFIHPERAIREMCRVLKPDGLISIEVPNSRYLWDMVRRQLGRRPISGTTQLISRVAPLDEWRRYLEHQGLKVQRIEASHSLSRSWKAIILRLTNPLTPLGLSYQFNFICRKQ